jgi:hypothetical protein
MPGAIVATSGGGAAFLATSISDPRRGPPRAAPSRGNALLATDPAAKIARPICRVCMRAIARQRPDRPSSAAIEEATA